MRPIFRRWYRSDLDEDPYNPGPAPTPRGEDTREYERDDAAPPALREEDFGEF